MKFITALMLSLFFCLITASVFAGSFGLSPYMVNTQIVAGQSVNLQFTVSGFSGVVEISAENMPVEISPKAIDVVDGSVINLKLICSSDVASGQHNGMLVFLAKSGSSVQSGIRVPCVLTVNGFSNNPGPSFDGVVGQIDDSRKTIIVAVGFVLVLLLIVGIVYLIRK